MSAALLSRGSLWLPYRWDEGLIKQAIKAALAQGPLKAIFGHADVVSTAHHSTPQHSTAHYDYDGSVVKWHACMHFLAVSRRDGGHTINNEGRTGSIYACRIAPTRF